MQPDAPVSQCDKGYDSATWIIKTSVGGHCDGSDYTNPYGCSSKCVWDSRKLSTLEECVGMTFDYLSYTYDGEGTVPNAHALHSKFNKSFGTRWTVSLLRDSVVTTDHDERYKCCGSRKQL